MNYTSAYQTKERRGERERRPSVTQQCSRSCTEERSFPCEKDKPFFQRFSVFLSLSLYLIVPEKSHLGFICQRGLGKKIPHDLKDICIVRKQKTGREKERNLEVAIVIDQQFGASANGTKFCLLMPSFSSKIIKEFQLRSIDLAWLGQLKKLAFLKRNNVVFEFPVQSLRLIVSCVILGRKVTPASGPQFPHIYSEGVARWIFQFFQGPGLWISDTWLKEVGLVGKVREQGKSESYVGEERKDWKSLTVDFAMKIITVIVTIMNIYYTLTLEQALF